MRYKIQNALTHIGNTGLQNLLTLIAVAFFTLILTTFLFNHTSVYKELELKETTPPLVAFINDTVVEDEARVFANQIQKKNEIIYVHYISKEENLNRAEKQLGLLGRSIKNSYSNSNPFPASFDIFVKSTVASRKALEEIAFDIESYDKIDDVILTGYGIISDLFRQNNRMTIASISVTILITFLIIRASVIKTARSRHEEITLLDLIGATPGYLRIPFIIHGMFHGLFGPIIGITCFYILYSLFTFQLGVLDFIPYYHLIAVVSSGLIIGIFAGIFAQSKYLKTLRYS